MELRGMQSQKSAPPTQQQPAQPRKKGRKIPIVQDSDSEDSEEEVKPVKQTKQDRVKPEPAKQASPKPSPIAGKKVMEQGQTKIIMNIMTIFLSNYFESCLAACVYKLNVY
jgi:hypothetical protein